MPTRRGTLKGSLIFQLGCIVAGESNFVRDVMRPDLESYFPGIVIIKQEPNASFQGIQDYILLFEDKWAALETKAKPKSQRRPNQEYYVDKMNDMSYSAFANPENWQEVLHALQEAFGVRG